MSTFPLCFVSAADFDAWKEAARFEQPVEHLGHCEDCTPEYAARMRRSGRCSRIHDIVFRKRPDGGVTIASLAHEKAIYDRHRARQRALHAAKKINAATKLNGQEARPSV